MRLLLMKSEKRSESIASEKYEVKDSGLKMMKGRLWMAKRRKKALNTNPASMLLL